MPVEMPTEYHEFHSTDEAERWAEVHFPDICGEQRASNPDYDCLYLYAGNGYQIYNADLRYGVKSDKQSEHEISQLTDILERYELPEPMVAYRYTHKQDLQLLLRGERLRPGLRFADKAFFSTSLVKSSLDEFRKRYKRNCLLKLYLPKGIRCAYISLKNTGSQLNEQELLLQRDTEFEIIKIHRFCCPMVIECRAIIKPTLEV